MSTLQEPDFKTLERNIIDIIQEEQIKLGYHKETIRLYYPMESIKHLLGTDLLADDLRKVLDNFRMYTMDRLGAVEWTHKDSRFCVLIPPIGVEYVHEKVEDRHFLRDFIETINRHGSTLEDILGVFHHYSEQVACEEVTNGEFDYLIYFIDGQPDAFLYCVKFEEHHAIYHRFTKADYMSFEW